MDLVVYARVLWRFKFLVAGGLLLAVGLAVLSIAKVTFAHGTPTLAYRKPLTYVSTSTVLITRRGFPWGSLADAGGTTQLNALSSFYAQLASSVAVKERLKLRPGEYGGISARPVIDPSSGSYGYLPMLNVDGYSTSPRGSIAMATQGTQAFIGYVIERQKAAQIPVTDRVVLQVINPALGASVVTPRKKTLPIMIFVLVVTATLGLAFMLENLRPSVRVAPGELPDNQPVRAKRPAVGTPVEKSASSAKSA